MTDKHYRVAVWSTGGIGSLSIGALADRDDLELVGVWVHSPEKVGKDSGELANGVPNGVAASGDFDALLALRPDCVIYAASSWDRDAAAVPDYVRILEAGVNVVTTTSTNLVNPSAYQPEEWRQQLEDAARKGGVSLYASGIHPGFALDQLVLTLATQSKRITSISVSELGMYDDYAVQEVMAYGLGFGQPLDFTPFVATPGMVAEQFQGLIRQIAGALDLEIDEVTDEYDRRVTEKPLDVAFGHVEAGTVGAIRMAATGLSGGRPAVTIQHVTRLAREVAPEWPIAEGDVAYRIIIEGEPRIECTMAPTLEDPAAAGIGWMGSGAGAMMATAMRVVNAVPHVVEAPPGLLGSADLPLTLPRHAFKV